MTVTAASFRAVMTAFADQAKYPDPVVQFWLDLAYKRHNADRWGDLLDAGIQLYVAHELALDQASGGTAAAVPGQVTGNITSRSVGGVSYTRDISSATEPDGGYMNLTTFGLRWRNLVKMVGAGPLQVGTPGPEDLRYSQAWAGPGTW